MENYAAAFAAALMAMPIAAIVCLYFWFRERRFRRDEAVAYSANHQALLLKHDMVVARFRPIIDTDEELKRVAAQLTDLQQSYAKAHEIHGRLIREVAIFDEKLAFAELGFYEAHFDYTDSEEYRKHIERARQVQKKMIAEKSAVTCATEWALDGSVTKGKTMTDRQIRLTLRAFNNECDAAIANARWNNVNSMEKRIVNARTQIDKLNSSNTTQISDAYLESKLHELYLNHEHREKQKAEKEERAEQARAAREEQRLLRDLERAEEEEARYQRLVAKAKAEAAFVAGPKLESFTEQIRLLERDLAQAHARVERAQALAERTRSGYVYIISNIGSFGENVVKIGLTRRLDPADRIAELGDASVPFLFDTHAIIYSDDAPGLERALHQEFGPSRINTENFRKEFFRVEIAQVEAAVKRLAPSASFFKDIEAQEYRETLARRNAALHAQATQPAAFPATLV